MPLLHHSPGVSISTLSLAHPLRVQCGIEVCDKGRRPAGTLLPASFPVVFVQREQCGRAGRSSRRRIAADAEQKNGRLLRSMACTSLRGEKLLQGQSGNPNPRETRMSTFSPRR